MKTPKSIIAVVSMLLAFACFAVIIGNTPKSSAESYNVTTTEKAVSTTEASTEDYQPPSSETTNPSDNDETEETEYQYNLNTKGEAVITNCVNARGKVVIPSTIDGYKVVEFYSYGFSYNNNITEVVIPEGVKSIPYQAFYGCTNLQKVVIPSTVESIGDYAFQQCINLKTVDFLLSDGLSKLKLIGYYSFGSCALLEEITIPDGVTNLRNGSFYRNGLKQVSLPASVTHCDEAFGECTKLESFEVAEGNKSYCDVDGILFNSDKTRMVIYPMAKTETEYEIPKTVTNIEKAFYQQHYLEKITFEQGTQIETIGAHAFYECISLKSFSVPGTVTAIDNYAFRECQALKSISFEKNDILTQIGSTAFFGCRNLSSLSLPASVKTIDYGAFMHMSSLTEFVIPAKVGNIPDSAFEGCTSLESVTIENGSELTSIGQNAFDNCGKLKGIIIPDTVVSIGDCAFQNAESLSEIFIPASVETIGSSAFYQCISLVSVDFEENSKLSTLGDNAFSRCALESISFADTPELKGIPENAFEGCVYLSEVAFGETTAITSIGEGAFAGCYSLQNIDLPDGISSVGFNAFYATPIYMNEENWENNVLYCWDILLGCNRDEFTNEELIIKDGTKIVSEGAFSGCETLKSVYIPDSVERIGHNAFNYCRNLETVTGGNGLLDLAYDMVFDDTKYSDSINRDEPIYFGSVLVRVPINFRGTFEVKQGTLAIGLQAFYGCRYIEKISLPDGLVTIGNSAFKDCYGLTEISLPEGLLYIGDFAFSNCQKLTKTELPSTVEYIGESAFSYCNIPEITIPVSVRNMCAGAFEDSGLEKVVFEKESKVTSLERTFYSCEKLREVILPDHLTEIGDYTFSNCGVENISLPPTLESIGTGAFSGCGFSELPIPDSVMEIRESAFAGNSNLTNVTFSDNSKIQNIRGSSFSNCPKLTEIMVPASVKKFDLHSITYWSNKTISLTVKYSGTAADWCKIDFGNEAYYVGNSNVGYDLYLNGELAQNVVISADSGLTEIADEAFRNCKSLITVSVPDGISRIGYASFANCPNLTNISLSSTVVSVDETALRGLVMLESITVSENNSFMTSENGVLYDKNKTELILYPANKKSDSLVIPEEVESIWAYAFQNAKNLKTVTFKKNADLQEVSPAAFYECVSLQKIILPDSIREIGDQAFYRCNNLSEIYLGRVEKIGSSAFYRCWNLKELTIPNTLDEVAYGVSRVDYGYTTSSSFGFSGIKNIRFESGITKIPDGVCFECNELSSVVIPSSVTEIGAYAFANTAIVNVAIPDAVESIGDNAFGYRYYSSYEFDEGPDEQDLKIQYALKNVSIGTNSKLKTIGIHAFEGRHNDSFRLPLSVEKCYSLPVTKDLYYAGNLSDWCKMEFSEPHSFENIYFEDELFSNKHLIVPETLTEIGSSTFAGFDFVETVSIPQTVNRIAYRAFYKCENIIAVNFQNADGNVEIGAEAFLGCKNLKNISIPANTTKIGVSAFYGCEALERIKLPDDIPSIPSCLFYGCTSLEEVEITEECKTKYIYECAFYNCSSLEKIFIPKDVVRIYDNAFAGCTSLTRFDVSAENEVFSNDAHGVLFDKAKAYIVRYPIGNRAEEYEIPATVEMINSDGGFVGAKYLSKFKVATANEHFSSDKNGVLFNKDKTSIIDYPVGSVFDRYAVPESVTFLNIHVFANHNNLRSVFVPSTVESLRYFWAFGDTYDYPLTVYFESTEEEVDSKTDDRISHIYYENLVKVYNHSQHSFDTVSSEATCSHSGYSGMMCKCGMIDGELTLLERTPHTPGEWEIERDSTDTEEGLRSMTCTVCGEKYKEEIIPKKSAAVSEDGVKVLYDKDDYEGEIEVIIEPANDDKIYEVVGGEYREENLRPYDIKMLLDGEEIQPNGKVKVRIPLPKGFDPYKTVIYYVNTKTGEKELIQSMFSYNDDGYIEFETDHFSYYVLAYKAKTATAVSYKINWNVDGAVTTVYLEAGDEIVIPQAPVKEGCTFKGWSPDVPDTMPAEDLTFIAVFEKNDDKPVTPPDVGKAVSISIRKPTTTTVNYGDTLILHATVSTLPDGCSIKWTVEGTGVKLSPSADGKTCSVTCTGSGAVSVKATVVDANGNAMSDTDGQEASANLNLTAKAGFFQKLISFFKNLFGSNRIIAQAFKNIF